MCNKNFFLNNLPSSLYTETFPIPYPVLDIIIIIIILM